MSSAALLFSDIEGSTRLLQRLGPAYGTVLHDHDALVRHCVSAHGGREQDKQGDSFFVIFDSTAQAVAAALDAQRAIARHPWPDGVAVRVRMGLHTGEISDVGDGFMGLAIHEAARIMGSAHGGQVLASSIVATLADPMPEGADWLDVGEHRLKDIHAPIRLMQLLHPDLPRDLPPPRGQRTRRTRLPAPTTALVGRDAEASELRSLVTEHRLITLTGAGGAGKTRLAERVAAEAEDRFADGVWLAEIALATEAKGITTALGSAVGAVEQSGLDDVAAVISDASALLVMDNCEHLIEDVAATAEFLLRTCPNLTILATSREPLGLPGEVTWRVPSLSPGDSLDLFVARARAADPHLALDDDKLATASAITQQLDGIPLAIELAAARLPTLGIDQLAARLDQRFALLTGGRRGGLARQRTLQAAVDWSYDLLEADQRKLLRWLGPFVGGFPLEGAEALGVEAGIGSGHVLDHLDALVQKSLVVAEERPEGVRYRLLETIRQYALDRLLDEQELAAARDAHARWVKGWCLELRRTMWNEEPPGDVYDRVEMEVDNLRGALDWSMETANGSVAADIAAPTGVFWMTRYPVEGGQRLMGVLDEGFGNGGQRLAMGVGAFLCLANARSPISDHFVDVVEGLARDVDEDDAYAFLSPPALLWCARQRRGPEGALAVATEQVERARASGHQAALGMTLSNLAVLRFLVGDKEGARATLAEAFEHTEATGQFLGVTRSTILAVAIERDAGNFDAAWDLANAGMAKARLYKDHPMIGAFMEALTVLAYLRGDLSTATAITIEGIDYTRWKLGPVHTYQAEHWLSWLSLLGGDPSTALEHGESACERARALNDRTMFARMLATAGHAARVAGREGQAIERFREGLDMAIEMEQEDFAASALYGLAAIAAQRGEGDLAAKLIGAGHERVRGYLDREQRPSMERSFFSDIEEQVRASAGSDFERLRDEGAKLSFTQASQQAFRCM